MFEGIHYGEVVLLFHTDTDEDALTQVVASMKKAEIKFELLPVGDWQDRMFIDILKYTSRKDGRETYCIVCGAECCYLQTKKLPDDMDIPRLIYDILGQEKGKKPMTMQSKFKKIFDDAMNQAIEKINTEDFLKADKDVIELFRKKVEATITDEEKEVDECDFEDEYNPVEEKTMFLYTYKVIADLLSEKGYRYENLKHYAEIDHHDVGTWKNDLKWLYDGFYWRALRR